MSSHPDPQRTLAKASSLTGTSLHTGEQVTLSLKPAPPGHGLRFRRMDLADQPFIEAHVSKVQMVERATTLAEGSVKVHTVEHVLSALRGMGVDNAVIEMDANEPPIGDGSAAPYVECIKHAGIADQDAPRPVYEIRETLRYESPQGALVAILPDRTFRISCTQMGPNQSLTQFASFDITPEIYEHEIAPARTFVHYEDVKPLLDKGLIRGGSIENAIVIRGETTLSKEPLRYPNEFARHKILDLIGDLALCGRPFTGHVLAIRPGHGPNTQMAELLARHFGRMISLLTPVHIPTGKGVLDVNEVMQVLPHRYPFLMVDRVVDFEGENKCTGVKSVSVNEPYFQGHFPGHPVMPGVLQLEAMAQVGSIILLRRKEFQGQLGYFMSADNVKFRKPVHPGDTLFIEAEILRTRRNIASAHARCVVGGETVSEAELKFSLFNP